MSFKTYSEKEIISYARKYSEYYADLYKDIPENATLEEYPLINQDDFWEHCDKNGGTVATGPQQDGQVFKSGGTTGKPKYSLYSAEEWQTMCECCGAVLARGGLTNGTRIANLFYSGSLYASFIYTYSMLYFAPVKTLMYNLSGNISVEEIVGTIYEHKIDCIAGTPSVIMKIAAYIEEHKMTGFAVRIVYFAGETLYQDQRDKLNDVFGRELEFRSIFYASNDGGPLGYYTTDCGFNEHRVMSDLCKLELIDTDTGKVITETNRPGAVYVTCLFKTLIPLIRYPAGDMAEYTEPEGCVDRKFKILGRSNAAARAGYVSIYPQDIGNVLKMCGIDYFAYQIIVEHEVKDRYIFKIAASKINETDTEKFMETLYRERSLLKEALGDGMIHEPKVEWCKPEDLEYNPRTGKLKVVIDKRMNQGENK